MAAQSQAKGKLIAVIGDEVSNFKKMLKLLKNKFPKYKINFLNINDLSFINELNFNRFIIFRTFF